MLTDVYSALCLQLLWLMASTTRFVLQLLLRFTILLLMKYFKQEMLNHNKLKVFFSWWDKYSCKSKVGFAFYLPKKGSLCVLTEFPVFGFSPSNEAIRIKTNRSVSLMMAFRYGMWEMSSLFGTLSPGQTLTTSWYNCSWISGSFAKWYKDHEIVLEVCQEEKHKQQWDEANLEKYTTDAGQKHRIKWVVMFHSNIITSTY